MVAQAMAAQVGTERADGEQLIYLGVRALAGVCDGAHKYDNVGFNGRDAQFGNSIAEKPWDQWSYRMRHAAWKMLRTYRNTQLPKFGIVYDEIPEPQPPACARCGKATQRGTLCDDCYRNRPAQQAAHTPAPWEHLPSTNPNDTHLPQAAAVDPVDMDGNHAITTGNAINDMAQVWAHYAPAYRKGARFAAGWDAKAQAFNQWFDGKALSQVGYSPRQGGNPAALFAMAAQQCIDWNRELAQYIATAPTPPTTPAPQPEPHRHTRGTVGLTTVDGRKLFTIATPYGDREVTDAVRAIPGRTWSGKPLNVWLVRGQIDSLDALGKLIVDFDMELQPGVQDALHRLGRLLTARVNASHAKDSNYQVEGLTPGMELRPFQRAGVRYAVAVKRPLIADDMGLGKTIQAIATVHQLQAYPCVTVAPKAVVEKWRREWVKWVPNIKVAVAEGGKLPVGWDQCHVVLCNPENVKKHLARLVHWAPESVIADEAHYFKNPKAQRSVAMVDLVETWERDKAGRRTGNEPTRSVPVRIALTGTPIENRPMEVWNIIKWLGWEQELGGWKFFTETYVGAEEGRFGLDTSGASNLQDLNRRLRSICMVRRIKEDVLTELPPLAEDTIGFEIDNRAEYEQAEEDLVNWVAAKRQADAAAIAADKAAAQLAGLKPGSKEYVAHMEDARSKRYDKAAEATARAQHLVRFNHLKQLAWAGMAKGVFAWIDQYLESGKPLVVFAWHQEAIEAIASRYNAPTITGKNAKDRQRAMDEFQAGQHSVIVCNLKAGGVGIDLFRADTVLTVELGWNPGVHRQAADRLHRMGQQNPVNHYYALATIGGDENLTIYGEIYRIILDKATVVDAATDGEAAEVQVGTMQQLQRALEARVAARKAGRK